MDGEPILIVRYETQQVHCIRNAKGEITEGSESEVFQSFLYDIHTPATTGCACSQMLFCSRGLASGGVTIRVVFRRFAASTMSGQWFDIFLRI